MDEGLDKRRCAAYNKVRKNQGADNMKTMKYGIDQLIHSDSGRPMLLEVFTDIDADNRALEDYFKSL